MKLKLLGTLALSSIILTACGQENVKKTESNPKEEQNKTDNMQTNGSVTNSNSNQKQKTAQKQISAQEAEQIVSNYYINKQQVLEFKTNIDRSNANEYYVEHLVRDAAGTPIKFCAVVNKSTGEVINRFNDMNEEEMKEFEEFKKRSPKYHNSGEEKNKMQENSSSSEQQEVHNSVI
ncbi:hypothetical protein [Staphylococcus epidermidis]|uniref:hypothetical protein n=1 Tax=Staphylococcus epidermidis TaxID=1282 RepID=UPI00241D0254|nr:hypothetical protein [Staphylococcus epidermidis]